MLVLVSDWIKRFGNSSSRHLFPGLFHAYNTSAENCNMSVMQIAANISDVSPTITENHPKSFDFVRRPPKVFRTSPENI